MNGPKPTLQRIEDMERQLSELSGLKTSVDLFLQRSQSLPKIEQEIGGIKETITKFSVSLRQVVQGTGAKYQELSQYLNLAMNRFMSLEQSLISLGKTISAITSELEGNKLINTANVLTRIRKMDEGAEARRIAEMVASNTIVGSEVVGESSMVVLQEFFQKKGATEKEVVSDFSVIELTSPMNDPKAREQLVGKKVGEGFTVENEEGTITGTITSIYELVQKSQEGETQEPLVEQQKPAESVNA